VFHPLIGLVPHQNHVLDLLTRNSCGPGHATPALFVLIVKHAAGLNSVVPAAIEMDVVRLAREATWTSSDGRDSPCEATLMFLAVWVLFWTTSVTIFPGQTTPAATVNLVDVVLVAGQFLNGGQEKIFFVHNKVAAMGAGGVTVSDNLHWLCGSLAIVMLSPSSHLPGGISGSCSLRISKLALVRVGPQPNELLRAFCAATRGISRDSQLGTRMP